MTHAHDHGHDHAHQHHFAPDTTAGRLLFTLILNLIIPAVQIAGGIFAGSVALISDAIHNLSDAFGLLVAYLADRVGRKPASARNTFGYRRAEILGAALNVVLLSLACAYIAFEAISRLINPVEVNGKLVMIIAAVGVLGNGYSALLLHRDSKHSLNVKGAFLHMLGDLLVSIVVLLNGLVLLFMPLTWLDPLLSLGIACFIVKSSLGILKQSVDILMNATPAGLDMSEIKNSLEAIPGVEEIHHLHAWNICANQIAFSCHVLVPDQPLSQTTALDAKFRQTLHERFGIDHPVLQFESQLCPDNTLYCPVE